MKGKKKDNEKFLVEYGFYDRFEMVCGDIYEQLFFNWAKENGLNF